MNILYIECKMGAAGDMMMAALYELLSDEKKKEFLETMHTAFPEIVQLVPESDKKCGICGTHMHVYIYGEEEHVHEHEHAHAAEYPHGHDHSHAAEHSHGHDHSHAAELSHVHETTHDHGHDHAHHSYASISEQIGHLPLPEQVTANAASVYRLIGEAEAHVHGTTIEQIHFHEVGSLDAVVDVVGCCLLFDMIGADAVYASPVHVGNGTVRCAHGILPVPAPATAEILKGIPFYTGEINSELCTPTGAAILKHFVRDFAAMPPMMTDKIGVGLGTKEFETANCVRIFHGTTDAFSGEQDVICDLSCNLDDMTGEALGYCMDVLFEEGALDVFYQALQMKKNRPGVLLHCFCLPADREKFIHLILVHTTTRGVRYEFFSRAKLTARTEEVETPYGTVRNKISSGYGVTKSKYEFEDLKKIAKESNLSLAEILSMKQP
jgi:hypothetical protein